MMLPKINPTKTRAWGELYQYFSDNDLDLRTLFQENPNRFSDFSVKRENFLFDYSKNLIDEKVKALLLQLAEECQLKEAIDKLFSGEKINETENRVVLHTALRDFSKREINVNGENVKIAVKNVLDQMKVFSERVISGEHKGFSGKEITDVVNIGIGGSDLGPVMVCSALKHFKTRLNIHFVSNVDGNHLVEVLKNLNPDISKHFVALSTNITEVKKFGIAEENIFEFWDWVGGRYSLWSSIGLSIVLAIGYDNFEQLLRGAYDSEVHFKTANFEENIPV